MKNKQPIKIIYLVDFLRTVNAGTERQLGHLLTSLPGAGYSVRLISLQDSPFLRDEASRIFPDVSFHSLGAKPDISRSFSSLVNLYRLLKRYKPDIVQCFFPSSNSIGVIIARLAGVRAVITSRRDMGYHLTKKDLVLYRIADLFVSRIICNSKAARERAIQLEGVSTRPKTVVINNGIALDGPEREINPDKQSTGVTVGIVANLNRQVKRVDIFIRAAAIVNKRFPDVKFWIIGDGSLRKELESLARSLGLNSSLFFLGRRSDVKDLLHEMAIGVISSDSEGLSNAIMEYMSAGLPVIATNSGGNPELVHDGINGYLFSPDNAGQLAAMVIKVLSDPGSASRMGKAGYRIIQKNFGIEKMLNETTGLYETLLNR
jgi:L-malate glycosyltransferase